MGLTGVTGRCSGGVRGVVVDDDDVVPPAHQVLRVEVQHRVVRDRGDEVRLLEPPIEIPGFGMVAVWHARAHRSAAPVWLREQMVSLAKDSAG